MGKVIMNMSLDGFIAGPKGDKPDRELQGLQPNISDWMFSGKNRARGRGVANGNIRDDRGHYHGPTVPRPWRGAVGR